MGRYRRQSKRNKNNMTEKKRKFNIIEQDLLEAYLRYYHHAANRVCFPPDSEGFDSDDDDETIRRSNLQGTAFENDCSVPMWTHNVKPKDVLHSDFGNRIDELFRE